MKHLHIYQIFVNLGIKDIDEAQFYKLIGLTDDEIKLINK
jgi:predicted lactoylglutathione lyase